jgi:hypothetical protein
MNILLLASFLFIFTNGDNIDLECVKNYLQVENQTHFGDPQKCKTIDDGIENFKSKLMEETVKIGIKPEFFAKAFEHFKIMDKFLRGLEIHIKDGTDEINYQKNVEASTSKIVWIIENFENAQNEDHVEHFNIFAKLKSQESLEIKLCKQKYFIKKGLIDSLEYNINMAAVNEANNCKDVFKDLEKVHKESKYVETALFLGLPTYF